MATARSTPFTLPSVPVPHSDFISYIEKHGAKPELLNPYSEYEAKLREGFAQHREDPVIQDPAVNAVPVFQEGNEGLSIQSRQVQDHVLNEKYIMPLKAKDRKSDGAPATVESMQDFTRNFNLFSESSLTDLDWSNVVAAGSSVVTSLLPVPPKVGKSKKAQREYYHQNLAPSSDVDLFIWGLDEAAAFEKIKQIEWSVRNAILEEVTTVRTKNAITIASHYPIRHVQIVLRLYKSVSEILTGFDVDCSCFAYDGKQVYGTPRALAAFKTQTNIIDLSRRSPSYESRLSKYAHRGFEVFCPELDRSRVDPTIFERSFVRTVGLARLLVLEQLPKPNDRDDYLQQRREERGRPSPSNYYWNRGNGLPGNLKDQDPDDVAEWIYDDEVSNYHSFTVPYGPKYHAKKIEKLLYTKDLLLNAEWNRNKDRTVELHRHPCFVGPIDNVIHDCCGDCPEPRTDEDREVAEEESKIYLSGGLEFMKDDPGRQAIGSFNPLSADDWTDMAYVGNTQELCQHICDGNLQLVQEWCERNPESIDRRDHTGRTPLHLAAQSSTHEVLKRLVDHGARIVARLVDGFTALHLASARGEVDMITTLLEKSEENENIEAEKEQKRRAAKHSKASTKSGTPASQDDDDQDEGSDVSMDDIDDSDEDTTMTEGSFVKVSDQKNEEDALDGDDADPDVYNVDVLAWDSPVSALHLAILGGHTRTIELLVSKFGADVLLPVKILDSYSRQPRHAIMTLILAARLSGDAATSTVKQLLSLGAASAQADMDQITAFHYIAAKRRVELLKACLGEDRAAARMALSYLVLEDSYWNPRIDNPLTTAIRTGDGELSGALLSFGAKSSIDLDDFTTAYNHAKESAQSYWRHRDDDVAKIWKEHILQPLFLAIENDLPDIVLQMIEGGIDANTLDIEAHKTLAHHADGQTYTLNGGTLLDSVAAKMSNIDSAIKSQPRLAKPITLDPEKTYLDGTDPDSYQRWYLFKTIKTTQSVVKQWHDERERIIAEEDERRGKQQKINALQVLQERFKGLKDRLLSQEAKTFKQLHPEVFKRKRDDDSRGNPDEELEDEKIHEPTFEPRVSFKLSTTDEIKEGYLQLFEAVWKGNIQGVKQLTLAKWGAEHDPLLITNQDAKGFTPYAIALYRRHLKLARVILEIADAQLKDQDEQSPRRRYTIAENDSSDASDEDDENELGISSEIVNETFTYDNVAALRQSVGSQVSATAMLAKSAEMWCLLDLPIEDAYKKLGSSIPRVSSQPNHGKTFFKHSLRNYSQKVEHFGRYALVCRDIELFRFWLRCCQEASKMRTNTNDTPFLGFYPSDFQYAIQNGFIEELSEMMAIAGAELPLDAFVKQSGVQEDEKPQYYQGLSIGGKKMTSWARERNGHHERTKEVTTPPLLQASYQGNLPAVEWFLSDTPFRLYKEYGAANADDPRLKALSKAHGGLDQAISSWLKQRSNLSLHAAVLSKGSKSDSLSVLQYLLSVFPKAKEHPSESGSLTPLALSFLSGRTDTASALINAEADQTTRDSMSRNLIHLAILYLYRSSKQPEKYTRRFRDLLNLLGPRLRSILFTERCRDHPGSLTPLAMWLAAIDQYSFGYAYIGRRGRLVPEILSIMLDFGGAEALTMMDGSGQFPLHQAVKHSYTGLVELMLQHDPALLARENAMGQTPLELAESLYVRECTKGNPDIRAGGYRPLVQRSCGEFVEQHDGGKGEGEKNDVIETWRVIREFAEKEPRPRKLVSVHEAREVARRLADRKKGENERDGEEKEEVVKKDEVDEWL